MILLNKYIMKIKFMNNHSTFIYNLKNILLSIFILLISNYCFSQSGWIQQNSGTNVNLNSVQFFDSEIGYCAGDSGILLRTTNSGVNWVSISSGTSQNLQAMTFPTQYSGYIVGDSGLVLKTSDGGNNWTNISFQSKNLYCLSFLNESTGYIGGLGISSFSEIPKIFKTTNGGFRWDSMVVNVAEINSMYFINETIGWITGELLSGDAIHKSSSGGFNWEQQYFSLYDNLKSIFFIDSLNGWVGSPKSSIFPNFTTIYKTTNAGVNWYDPYRSTSNISYSIYFANLNKGWAAGDYGLIHFTINGGLNWIAQTPPTANRIYRSINFTDSLNGWCVGNNGVILKTTTGGVLTNFTNISSEIPEKFSLSQNYPNPFNPNTFINYQLPMFNFISLKVYDVLGNEVATIVNENQNAGTYSVEFKGNGFSSGVYYYKLETADFTEVKRMMLVK